MFDNKFNSRKPDPLVEAVKEAQRNGELRRQAEAYVNEELDVVLYLSPAAPDLNDDEVALSSRSAMAPLT